MRWVTYFPKIERIHLTKDVGLIPYNVGLAGHEATLLGQADPSMQIPEEVEGLSVEFMKDEGKLFFLNRAFLSWLKANARNVDVLHLFHLSRDTVFYGAYFKKLNPSGKLYLKMDAYNDHLLSRKRYAKNFLKNVVIKNKEREFLKALDLVTIENRRGLELTGKTYPELKNKLAYLPNGVNDGFIGKYFTERPPKEKLILSVTRSGSEDKNVELFLKAFPLLVKLPDWKFVIVGPISEAFHVKLDKFMKERPELAAQLSFTGGITDRSKIYDLYARSSVFFLPSRVESFGIAFVEALYFGNCLVGHRGMSAYEDISDHGKYGTYFTDHDAGSLARSIEKAAEKSRGALFLDRASQFAKETFSWSKLTEKLIAKLDDA